MKLGPHGILTTDAAIQWSRRAPITKSLDRVGLLQQAQPGAITIFRGYFTPAEQDRADPDFTFDRIMERLQGFVPTYTELNNEWRQRLIWGLASHVEFTRACVKRFHAVGIRVAGFSFSTGQPEMEDWLYLQEQDFAGVDVVAIHEYWNGKTGYLSGWNALRYRKIHDILGGKHPPWLVTECGADAVEQGKPGWRLCGISGEQYIKQLLAYNAELEKDSYVLGATPFTSGPGPGNEWANFDMDGDSWRIPGGAPPTIPDVEVDSMPTDETKEQLKLYARWALARIDNDEDPVSLSDFRAHLLAIGANQDNPAAYGWIPMATPINAAMLTIRDHAEAILDITRPF